MQRLISAFCSSQSLLFSSSFLVSDNFEEGATLEVKPACLGLCYAPPPLNTLD